MEPKLKSAKLQNKEEESDAPDRLSCLPDSIISHILSFLDTKTAVGTSALSKRYKLLWTLTQRLDFKLRNSPLEDSHLFSGHLSRVAPPGISRAHSFKSYVNRVLQLRERSNLTSFRLSMHKTASDGLVESCIDYAVKHKVQHLKISIGVADEPHALPKALITSSSLVSLNLHAGFCWSIKLPKSVALPNLKELSLKNFQFCNVNFSGEIFSGCPNLETLVLSKCCINAGGRLKILDVGCPNLVRLEIKWWRSPPRCFDEQAINVNAPKLAFFALQGHLARVNLAEHSSGLNACSVQLFYPSACASENGIERKQRTAEYCIDLLRQMRSAKSLSLSSEAVEILSTLRDLRQRADFIFENLKYITITTGNNLAEDIMPIDEAATRKRAVAGGSLPSDATKERKLSSTSSKFKLHGKSAKHVSVPIPTTVLQFLTESSPSAELLILKTAKGDFIGTEIVGSVN